MRKLKKKIKHNTTLGEITKIEHNITNAKLKSVQILHKAVYGVEDQPRQRECLRNFQGFHFDKNSQEFNKVEKINEGLELSDVMSMCYILNLDYEGDKHKFVNRISTFLNNLTVNDEVSEEEDEVEKEIEEEVVNSEESEYEDNIPLSTTAASTTRRK